MKFTSYCVKVRKNDCEKVLKVIKDLGILKEELRILKDHTYVYIPITREDRLEDITRKLPGVEIVIEYRDFDMKPKYLGDYRGLLRDLISEDLLRLMPRSYDIVGDIALVSLPPELLNYGKYVGEAIMRVNKNVRAVYRVGTTYGDFRVRELTHLAGDEVYTTVHKEYGIKFYVDLKNVYFNPALSEEHHRVALEVSNGDRVLDLFTGVGPFALHIACSKRAYILANDLNPYATSCLLKSIELNKRKLIGHIDIVNSDANEILSAIRPKTFDKIIMNLPLKSHEYLNKALDVLKENGIAYIYTVASDTEEALNKIITGLNSHTFNVGNIIKVIDYAPHRYVFRVNVIKVGS